MLRDGRCVCALIPRVTRYAVEGGKMGGREREIDRKGGSEVKLYKLLVTREMEATGSLALGALLPLFVV